MVRPTKRGLISLQEEDANTGLKTGSARRNPDRIRTPFGFRSLPIVPAAIRPVYSWTPDLMAATFEDYVNVMPDVPIYKTEVCKTGASVGEQIYTAVQTPLTLKGFCSYAGIVERVFKSWCAGETPRGKWSTEEPERMQEVCEAIDMYIGQELQHGALVGLYNAGFVAAMLGMNASKIEIDQKKGNNVKLEQITGMTIK